MNRIFIIILICSLFLLSCIRKDKEYMFVKKISLTNETQNNILFYFEMSNSFQDTLSANGNEYVYSSDTTIVIAKSYWGARINYPVHLIEQYNLYDFTDTMSYKLQIVSIFSKIDSAFIESVFDNTKAKQTEQNRIVETKIIYDEYMKKLIMHKDYSMLEKFPEYYSK